jgi:hypothetical protein
VRRYTSQDKGVLPLPKGWFGQKNLEEPVPTQHRNQPAQRHRMAKQLLATVALAATASANDPAGSWLSYAAYTDPGHGIITALNTTWTVPSNPASNWGSNAPG